MPKSPNNAYLSSAGNQNEVILYDKAEAVELFGEDHLEEFGSQVPDELVQRYKAAEKERSAVQVELRALLMESIKKGG